MLYISKSKTDQFKSGSWVVIAKKKTKKKTKKKQGNVSCQIFTDVPVCFQYSRKFMNLPFRKLLISKNRFVHIKERGSFVLCESQRIFSRKIGENRFKHLKIRTSFITFGWGHSSSKQWSMRQIV